MHSTCLATTSRPRPSTNHPDAARARRCGPSPRRAAAPIVSGRLPPAARRRLLAAASPGGEQAGGSSPSNFDADDPAAWAARRAADLAVERFVCGGDGAVKSVGVGAGEAAHHLIAALAAAAAAGRLPPGLTVACAGAPAAAEAAVAGLTPAPPPAGGAAFPATDLFFVTASALDPTTRPRLAYITGAGPPPTSHPGAPQPALAESLAGARAAKAVVALVPPGDAAGGGADGRLGPAALPVLVSAGTDEEEWEAGAEDLDDAFLGDAEVWRRPSAGPGGPAGGGVNPRGGPDPYVSADGTATILDVWFLDGPLRLVDDEAVPYEAIHAAAADVTGFIDCGLVPASAAGAASAAVIAGVGPGGAPVVVEV